MINSIEIEERISKCEKILAVNEDSQIFAALADAYRKKGNFRKAKQICLEGMKKHPNYSSARIVMAKIHISNRDYDSAWDELKLAVSFSGRTRAIDILESEILIYKGEKDRARLILNKLRMADPTDEVVKNLIKLLDDDKTQSLSEDNEPISDKISQKTKEQKLSLSEALKILNVFPKVIGIAAINNSNSIAEGYFCKDLSIENTNPTIQSIYDSIMTSGEKINLGSIDEILIETQSNKFWILNKNNYLLLIYTKDDVNMGSLKLKLDQTFQKLDQVKYE